MFPMTKISNSVSAMINITQVRVVTSPDIMCVCVSNKIVINEDVNCMSCRLYILYLCDEFSLKKRA